MLVYDLYTRNFACRGSNKQTWLHVTPYRVYSDKNRTTANEMIFFSREKINWKWGLFYIIIYFRENWLRNLWSSCVVWLLTGFHAVRYMYISMNWCVPIWFTIYKHCVGGINGKVCTIVVQTLLFVDSITNCVEEIFSWTCFRYFSVKNHLNSRIQQLI